MSYYRQGPYRPSGFGLEVPGLTPYVKYLMVSSAAVWLAQLVFRWLDQPLEPLLGVVPHDVLRGQIWQLGTYMFLHNPQDPFHLLFNMLMLWMFGGELERFWGPRGFLIYYLICGLGAGVTITLAGLATGGVEARIPTTGASGALFGVFVAYGIVFARRTVLFMLLFPMQARTMAMLLTGLSLFYLIGQPGSGVSHVAHLGGAATGFLYLKRVWRVGDLYRELRWKVRRRRFKMVPPPDDRWVH
jgi:membrane associated rhomboid family serine protease